MIKTPPRTLARDISDRSTCRVRVGAVLEDQYGIFSWGWNGMGPTGLGLCAEAHAISRANPKRLRGANIYVYGKHRKTSNPTPSMPCSSCSDLVKFWDLKVCWSNKGVWRWL